MLDLFSPSDLFALAIFGAAAPILGACRWLKWSWLGSGVSVALVAGVGVASWQLQLPLFVPLLAAGLVLLYGASLVPESARQWLLQASFSRSVIVPVLVLGGWLASGSWLAHVVHRTLQPGLDASQLMPAFAPIEGIDLPDPAYTDRGRSIRLLGFPPSDEADMEELRRHEQWYAKHHELSLIRIGPADRLSNCHGWVFTNGRYNLHSEDIDTILEDNGYRVVAEPAAGDLVIYRDGLDRVTHSGMVRMVSGKLILIESKWGHLGVYLHPVEVQPYGNDWSFMRSNRPNHVIRLSPPDMDGMHITP